LRGRVVVLVLAGLALAGVVAGPEPQQQQPYPSEGFLVCSTTGTSVVFVELPGVCARPVGPG
jgi:hypothetical protein